MFEITTVNDQPVLSSNGMKELQKLKEFQITKQEMQNEEDELKMFAKGWMEENNKTNCEMGGIKFTLTKQSVRKTIDKKRLTAELPDIAEEYTKETVVAPSVRMDYGD